MVNRVHRVVVFLSKPYVTSPNCCVEIAEAVLHPEKLIVCVLDDVDPNIVTYLKNLKGTRVCNGFEELIGMLDVELQDVSDARAYDWWRKQKISGAGVPSHVVITDPAIPMFSLCSGTVLPPEKSLDVGPLYLAGDLRVRYRASIDCYSIVSRDPQLTGVMLWCSHPVCRSEFRGCLYSH